MCACTNDVLGGLTIYFVVNGSLEWCGLVVGAVDAFVGCGLTVLVDCLEDLFDGLAEGCFVVGMVVFVVEVGGVCLDLLFGGGDVCVYVGEYSGYVFDG